MLNKKEQEHYHRHLILDDIGEEGQLKLKAAKVLVIGAGGLGCPVLQYLTAAGIGTIGVVDNDIVDQSNLQRQILFTINDLGQNKAEIAAKRLAQLNPFTKFKIHPFFLTNKNAIELFEQYDIVVDGSDNFPTRYLVNDAAVLTNIPVVFGSIFKFEGQVSVFNYKGGPTYRCLYPKPPEPNSVPSCSEIGVLGVLPGLIGCIQANEVLKIVCGIGEILSGKLLRLNALSMQQQILTFQKIEKINIKALDNYNSFCGIHTGIPQLTPIELNKLLDSSTPPLLIDVREPHERATYNIGGLHIPLSELTNNLEKINASTVVFYCQSGVRSRQAAEILLNSRANTKVLSLEGGMNEWRKEMKFPNV